MQKAGNKQDDEEEEKEGGGTRDQEGNADCFFGENEGLREVEAKRGADPRPKQGHCRPRKLGLKLGTYSGLIAGLQRAALGCCCGLRWTGAKADLMPCLAGISAGLTVGLREGSSS